MSWQRLDAVSRRVLRRIERAERAVAAAQPSEIDKEKAPRAMKPEASNGWRTVKSKVQDTFAMPTMGMCGRMETEPPQLGGDAATPSMRRHMFTVIEGGRRAPLEGGAMRPAGRRNSGEGAACEWLKLVHAST